MRILTYVPIIHTSADLGSLAKYVTKRGIADLGEPFWQEHQKAVYKFWDCLMRYFDFKDVSGVKIYQDGMVAEGEVGEKIVEETAKAGSKNYELVSKLLKRGAILVKTESFKLVKEERDRLFNITQAKSIVEKLIAFIGYKLTKGGLLNKRDNLIAKRIDETLQHGEKGILFIGAYHNIKDKLSKSIQVREIKDIKKVREYQNLLPFHDKYKERYEALKEYLISPIGEKDNPWV